MGSGSVQGLDKLKEENSQLKEKVAKLEARLSRIYSAGEDGDAQRLPSGSDPQPGGISFGPDVMNAALTVVVIGASGDLAAKKTYPALFSLFCNDLLPSHVIIAGYARTAMDDGKFKEKISKHFNMKKFSEEKKKAFLAKCFYYHGLYDKQDDWAAFNKELVKHEAASEHKKSSGDEQKVKANRIFYMAIPPSIFVQVGQGIQASCMSATGWSRVIVEKPFGKDSESSAELGKQLAALFDEDQIYRIDHYLGKEMVQNLMTLRFANSVFEPLWNRQHIKSVQITFKEDFGTQGRGGYFDEFGIIRDVMQNHLLQILSLVAMDAPVTLNAEDVRNEKVKILRYIPPIKREDIVIGQYGADPKGKEAAYTDDPTVPKGSVTPTFAAAVLHIRNPRWDGTPFILKCGKALNERKAEIRIQFHKPLNQLYQDISPNELVMRLQPDEAIYLKMTTKKPGLIGGMLHTELDLTYKDRFKEQVKDLPDAYERLILDVIRGDHNLFVRADELVAAWKIFTPILHELERQKVKPIAYEYGSRGPKEADELISRYGYERTTAYRWQDGSKDEQKQDKKA